MKLVVTGSNGFLGKAVCAAALGLDMDVLKLARTPSVDDMSTVAFDLAAPPWQAIRDFGADAVLHLAWIATPGEYLHSPENEHLLHMSKRFLSGCRDLGIRHLAAAGTCIEYAPSSRPLQEFDSPLAAGFPYSRAKLELFRWMESELAGSETDWSWFRVFYPYGPGEHSARLPSTLIRQLAANQKVVLRTPGSVKDYLFISDLAQAMLVVMRSRGAGPFNVGSGEGVAIRDLARLIAGIVGADPALIAEAAAPSADPWPVHIANIDRLQGLGWRPQTTLRVGLTHLAQHLAACQN